MYLYGCERGAGIFVKERFGYIVWSILKASSVELRLLSSHRVFSLLDDFGFSRCAILEALRCISGVA